MQEVKKISSLPSRTISPAMQKRMTSSPSPSPLGAERQKPMKHAVKHTHTDTVIRKNKKRKHSRKDLMFDKVVSYLLSDSYMYSPLVCGQPTFDLPPPKEIVTNSPGEEEEMALPFGRRKKLFLEEVVDFLETDCYLYSPLLTKKQDCSKYPLGVRTRPNMQARGRSSTPETQGGHAQPMAREDGDLGRHRPTVVRETVTYRESVKHVVHQNRHSKPIQAR